MSSDEIDGDGKPGKPDTRRKARKKIAKLETRASRLLSFTKKENTIDGKRKRGKKAKNDYIPEQIAKMKTMWENYFEMPNENEDETK